MDDIVTSMYLHNIL